MISDNWIALMAYCKDNPYMMIERLEIYESEPVLIVIRKQISNSAIANIRIKYNPTKKVFSKS